jgi:hypothetical protein
MKNRAIELQEKANQILQMAQDMDKRIILTKGWLDAAYKSLEPTHWYILKQERDLESQILGSKRLWNAYLQLLTQIKLELTTVNK